MQLTVIHDRDGNIQGATAHAAGTPPSGPRLQPGQYATEIEAMDIGEDLDPAVVFEQVARIVKENKVEVENGKGRLNRK